MSDAPYNRSGDKLVVEVHAQPGAKREGIVGLHGGALKITLQAPAVDGKANKALVRYLAEALGIKKSDVVIVAGLSARKKRVQLPLDAEEKLKGLVEKAGQ